MDTIFFKLELPFKNRTKIIHYLNGSIIQRAVFQILIEEHFLNGESIWQRIFSRFFKEMNMQYSRNLNLKWSKKVQFANSPDFNLETDQIGCHLEFTF